MSSLKRQTTEKSGNDNRARKDVARPQPTSRNQLRVQNSINENYCRNCVTEQDSVYVSSKVDNLNPPPVLAGLVCNQQEKDCKFTCELLCSQSCSFCKRISAKERCKSHQLSLYRNKVCERCFLCMALVFCKSCHKCPNSCSRSTCRGQIAPVLGKVGSPRDQLQSCSSPQGRLHPPFPVPSKFDQVTNYHKLLCKSPQEPLLIGGIASVSEQKCSGTGSN